MASLAAAHASAFYREVAAHRHVYAVRDGDGFPAPKNRDGHRSMPFWSKRSRAEQIVAKVPAYANFEVVEIAWNIFRDRWIPGLENDGLRIGVNWSGRHATGYDLSPQDVLRNVEAQMGGAP